MKLNAKCSVVASMNPKNCAKSIDTSNMTIEESLLSRFDLVFELEDLNDREMDATVINHILSSLSVDSGKSEKKSHWSTNRLMKHIMIAKNIPTTLTEGADKVIFTYFWKKCKDNFQIDQSRRTMRLLTSLQRLTKCHAKLMLRREAIIHDALNAIMIMEQTWTFGHLMQRKCVAKSNIPLGMSLSQMSALMHELQLDDQWEEYLGSKVELDAISSMRSRKGKGTQDYKFDVADVDMMMSGADDEPFKILADDYEKRNEESTENVDTSNTQKTVKSSKSYSEPFKQSQDIFDTQGDIYANLNRAVCGDEQTQKKSPKFQQNDYGTSAQNIASPPKQSQKNRNFLDNGQTPQTQIYKTTENFSLAATAKNSPKTPINRYQSAEKPSKTIKLSLSERLRGFQYESQSQQESQSQGVNTQIPENMEFQDVESEDMDSDNFDPLSPFKKTDLSPVHDSDEDDDLMNIADEVEQSQQILLTQIPENLENFNDSADEFDPMGEIEMH